MDGLDFHGHNPAAVAYLNRVGTAVPANGVYNAFRNFADDRPTAAKERRLFGGSLDRAGTLRLYSRLGCKPSASLHSEPNFLRNGDLLHGDAVRRQAFEREAAELAVRAVRSLSLGPGEATDLILASCTGFVAPGLDQSIAKRLGFGGVFGRTAVGSKGSYAAIPALRSAAHLIRWDPSARVLIVNLELCPVHLHATEDIDTLLSYLAFGDAASAMLVTADPYGMALHDFAAIRVHCPSRWADTNGCDVRFEMRLSSRVRAAIAATLRDDRARGDCGGLLQGAATDDIHHWAVHAGAITVLDLVERGLGLSPLALALSRAVLHDVGNVSSATLPFVLARILAEGAPGPGLAMALGPAPVVRTVRFTLI